MAQDQLDLLAVRNCTNWSAPIFALFERIADGLGLPVEARIALGLAPLGQAVLVRDTGRAPEPAWISDFLNVAGSHDGQEEDDPVRRRSFVGLPPAADTGMPPSLGVTRRALGKRVMSSAATSAATSRWRESAGHTAQVRRTIGFPIRGCQVRPWGSGRAQPGEAKANVRPVPTAASLTSGGTGRSFSPIAGFVPVTPCV